MVRIRIIGFNNPQILWWF